MIRMRRDPPPSGNRVIINQPLLTVMTPEERVNRSTVPIILRSGEETMPEDSKPDRLDTASAAFWTPPLAVLRDALEDGLSRNYRRVAVQVKECPDLRRLGGAWEGLGGAPCLVEVGGEPYAHNPRYRDVRFETEEILRGVGHPGPQVLGAGMACTTTLGGHCGEVIANHDTRTVPESRAAPHRRAGPVPRPGVPLRAIRGDREPLRFAG